MTGRDWVKAAFVELGILDPTETPSNDVADGALSIGNDWIDSLANDGLTIYFLLRTTKTLASGTASYTIGTGGSINIVRPTKITYARLIIDTAADPTTEIPLDILTDQAWQAISQKSLESSLPQAIYYDHGWSAGLGLIYPWPVPDVGTTQLVLYTPQALTEFTDLNTDLTFPPGYRLFLKLGLAEQLAPQNGKTLTTDQIKNLRTAKALVKGANRRPVEARVDEALLGGRGRAWNWRVGGPR